MEERDARKKTLLPESAEGIDVKIQPAGIVEDYPAEIVLVVGTRKETIL